MTTTQKQPTLIRRVFNAVWFHLRHLLVRRYRVRYQHNLKHLVADILILLIVIALIVVNGYIFLVFTKWAVSLQVQVSIDGPTAVRSGLPVEYTVTVANTARRGTLTDVVLLLDIPSAFQVEKVSEPLAVNNQVTWENILPRQRRQLTIFGVWLGNYDDSYQLAAQAVYQQFSPVDETLQWTDERDSSSQITINGSTVACTVLAPAKGVSGEYVWLTVQCKNDGTETVDQVELSAPALVGNGQLTRSIPAAAAGKWLLGSLAAGEQSELVQMLIQLNGAVNTVATIPLELRGVSATTNWLLDRPTASIGLVPSPVAITMVSNGQANLAPQPGEEQTLLVTIQNISKQSLVGITPVVDFSASIFDRQAVVSEPAGEWRGDWLVWPARTINAGESATITIKAATPVVVTVSQQQIIAGIIQSDNDNLASPTFSQWTLFTQAFSSRLELTALARYYTRDGEQIGLGPLPPIVGFPTRYRVFFEVATDRNQLQSVSVKGVLSKNVTWDTDNCTGISDGFSFNAERRELEWQAGSVAADQSAMASFCLTLTPLANQVGMFAPLMSDVVATGKDSKTERWLKVTSNTITTALPLDPFTAGRGKVTR